MWSSRKRVYGASFRPSSQVVVVERAAKRFKGQSTGSSLQGLGRGSWRYPTSYRPRISARAPLTTQVSQIRRALRQTAPEVKYADVDVSAANVTTAGQLVYATQIGQGDTLGTRDGEGVRLKSFDLRGRITMPVDSGSADNLYSRVFVVRDKQNASASPSSASVIFDYVTNPTMTRVSLDTLGRFDVMWASPILDFRRMVSDVDNQASVPTQSNCFSFQWKGDLELRYFGSNSTDLEKNPIYVVYTIGPNSADATDFVATVRLGYTDS